MCRVVWQADGHRLASGSDDRSVCIWDTQAAAPHRQGAEAHPQQDTSSDTSSAQAEGPPPTGRCLMALRGHTARVWDCAFGDCVLFTASEDCTAR